MTQTDIYDDSGYNNPALYDGVRSKRIFAFSIDYALVLPPIHHS